MYKVLPGFIHNHINKYAEEILGECQFGFWKNRSTIYYLYTLCQMYEKFDEFNIDIQLFVDFQQASNRVNRKTLIESLMMFGILRELVQIVWATMIGNRAVVPG